MDKRQAQATVSSPFTRFEPSDVRALVAEYPLAWVCAKGGEIADASQLPLIGEFDAQDRLHALIGHLARANPLSRQLAAAGRTVILFNGPNGYVSPEQAGRRDWAPTWNYAQLRIAADIELAEAHTEKSLAVLIDAMERDRADPWHHGEIGSRYARMTGAIIGFRATVTAIQGRFKLGQDESDTVLTSILANHPDAALVRWMRRFSERRPRSD